MAWAEMFLGYPNDLYILTCGAINERYWNCVFCQIGRLYAVVGPAFILIDDTVRTNRTKFRV